MTIHVYADRVVHVIVDQGVVLDLKTGKVIRDRIAEITNDPYVVVGDPHQVAFVDRETPTELTGNHGGRLLATATIVGKGCALPFLARR